MAAPRLCSIPDCGKIHSGRGLCAMHLMRSYRHGGDPLAGGTIRRSRPDTCEVEGCNKSARTGARGLCPDHYSRLRRNGDPNAGRTRRGSLANWLIAHRDWQGDECLAWPFFTTKDGYGYIRFRGKGMRASRAMCIVAHGEPPTPDHEAAHSCGNGHEGCANQKHLRWATSLENNADKVAHGTLMCGECAPQAKLTEAGVIAIRGTPAVLSQSALAALHGVSRATIGDVITRRTWKHI